MIGECMFLMHGLSTWMFSTVHLFGIFDSIPSVFFGFPLVLLASVVFAATHHESPDAIRWATIHWTIWISGILGVVFLLVYVLSQGA